ncbi:MAG: hypothetical protein BZY88_07715 [SAR202 cluster bacterium Io17-Chloro-G9]|nr:MAG: hypothetical protein BZY88_07715 [SAR202 cluster bacterium Io17-Chloro-G9]
MNTLFSKMTGSALDLLFPLECAGCQKQGAVLCGSCLQEAPRLKAPYCRLCGQPGHTSPCGTCREIPLAIHGIRAPFILEGPVRHVIHHLKYRNLRAAAPQLGQILGEHLRTHRMPGSLLVPVPLHASRLRQRGYNQSELLAKAASQTSEIPLEPRLLSRTKNTQPQVESQGRDQRRANVEGSFKCRSALTGVSVILIDDVATTGSTLSACAAALKAAGAESVWGLVLAREA